MRLKTPMRIQFCAAAFAGGIALVGLLRWSVAHLGSAVSNSAFDSNPITAIACVMVALALILSPRRPTFLLAILTIAVISIGAAKLAQVLLALPVGIDQLIFPDPLAGAGTVPTTEMRAEVGLALALLGCGLLVGPSSNRCAALASQFPCAVVMVIAMVAAAGTVLDGLGLAGVIRVGMSLDSALTLMALAIGVASIRGDAEMRRGFLDRVVAGLLALRRNICRPLHVMESAASSPLEAAQ